MWRFAVSCAIEGNSNVYVNQSSGNRENLQLPLSCLDLRCCIFVNGFTESYVTCMKLWLWLVISDLYSVYQRPRGQPHWLSNYFYEKTSKFVLALNVFPLQYVSDKMAVRIWRHPIEPIHASLAVSSPHMHAYRMGMTFFKINNNFMFHFVLLCSPVAS